MTDAVEEVYRCYSCKRETKDRALVGRHFDPQSGAYTVCINHDACTLRRLANMIEKGGT